jgi:predicted DNA-binding protein (MmcQ/YjbR family)
MAKAPAPGPEYEAALARLRALSADWPGVTETTSWGNPTFKAAGKSFAVLDRYKGDYCIWLRCDPARREDLLAREGYFPAPYDKNRTAVCRLLDGLDWDEFRHLVRDSYERVMPG